MAMIKIRSETCYKWSRTAINKLRATLMNPMAIEECLAAIFCKPISGQKQSEYNSSEQELNCRAINQKEAKNIQTVLCGILNSGLAKLSVFHPLPLPIWWTPTSIKGRLLTSATVLTPQTTRETNRNGKSHRQTSQPLRLTSAELSSVDCN